MKVLRDVGIWEAQATTWTRDHQLLKSRMALTTTADKIRALAQANYDHTEISKILGIRYQHVRHVMLRSGLTGGLRREAEAEREPVEVDAAPAPRDGLDRANRGRLRVHRRMDP